MLKRERERVLKRERESSANRSVKKVHELNTGIKIMFLSLPHRQTKIHLPSSTMFGTSVRDDISQTPSS